MSKRSNRKTEIWTVRFLLVKVHPSLICRIKGELRVDAIDGKQAYLRANKELRDEFPKWNESEFLLRRANDVTGKWIKLTNKGGITNAEKAKVTNLESQRKPRRRNRTRNGLRRVADSDGNNAA